MYVTWRAFDQSRCVYHCGRQTPIDKDVVLRALNRMTWTTRWVTHGTCEQMFDNSYQVALRQQCRQDVIWTSHRISHFELSSKDNFQWSTASREPDRHLVKYKSTLSRKFGCHVCVRIPICLVRNASSRSRHVTDLASPRPGFRHGKQWTRRRTRPCQKLSRN